MPADTGALKPPQGFDALLEELAREVLRLQPTDIKVFAAQLLADKLSARCDQSQNNLWDTAPTGVDDAIIADLNDNNVEISVMETESHIATPSKVPEPEPISDSDSQFMEAPRARRGRRVSVSAESMNPEMMMNMKKVVHPKTEDVQERIRRMVTGNFLFNNLDAEQLEEVVLAMFEKAVADGEDAIKQGDDGDYFYVVESGAFDIFVTPYGEEAQNVGSYGPGGSFGELALMYNAPRAATIRCTSDAILWAMDRMTFRRILMDTTSKKRRMYEAFLSTIDILSCIEPYERVKIADGLESQDYSDGEDIIKQGEMGDKFYLLEKGELMAIVDDMEVATLKKGDYFGELALLFSQPRKATVRAIGEVTVAYLDIEAFNRMLGPCSEIMKRSMSHYDEEVTEAKKRAHA